MGDVTFLEHVSELTLRFTTPQFADYHCCTDVISVLSFSSDARKIGLERQGNNTSARRSAEVQERHMRRSTLTRDALR